MSNTVKIFCCNKSVSCGEIWFLQDIKNFTARRLFVGQCPVCNNNVAVLIEKRIDDNKQFVNSFTGINAVKTIFREKNRKVTVIPDIKIDSLYGWVYGVNTQIKNRKGQVVKVRQYASDFAGNKSLRKEINT